MFLILALIPVSCLADLNRSLSFLYSENHHCDDFSLPDLPSFPALKGGNSFVRSVRRSLRPTLLRAFHDCPFLVPSLKATISECNRVLASSSEEPAYFFEFSRLGSVVWRLHRVLVASCGQPRLVGALLSEFFVSTRHISEFFPVSLLFPLAELSEALAPCDAELPLARFLVELAAMEFRVEFSDVTPFGRVRDLGLLDDLDYAREMVDGIPDLDDDVVDQINASHFLVLIAQSWHSEFLREYSEAAVVSSVRNL